MSNLLEKIDEIVPEGNKHRHSFFQLQYFVIQSEPTIQSKINACKRELVSRKNSMEGILLSIEEAYDQKELHELNISEIQSNTQPDDEFFVIRRREITIKQARRKIRSLESQIQDLKDKLQGYEEEANFIIGLYYKLIEREPEQDFYTLQNQAEYWNAKLNRELESRLLLGQIPDTELIKTIYNCPDAMPVKQNMQKLIETVSKAAQNKKIESSATTK